MRKEIKRGDGKKFVNAAAAIMALQAAQVFYSLAGYLTSTYICTETGRVELTVHFSDKPYLKIPMGYNYSVCEIESHEYWSDYKKSMIRVRTMCYTYKY